jgi:hypothetical protein
MKPSSFPLRAGVLAIALGGAAFAAFSIPWHTQENGGGRSTGTDGATTFAVTGTVGQFEASAGGASGGGFSLNGGYWARVVGSGPPLAIIPQPGGTALLQWQANAAGWHLEKSVDLDHWTPMGGVITGTGTLPITPDPGTPRQFFRLARP